MIRSPRSFPVLMLPRGLTLGPSRTCIYHISLQTPRTPPHRESTVVDIHSLITHKLHPEVNYNSHVVTSYSQARPCRLRDTPSYTIYSPKQGSSNFNDFQNSNFTTNEIMHNSWHNYTQKSRHCKRCLVSSTGHFKAVHVHGQRKNTSVLMLGFRYSLQFIYTWLS